MWNCKLTVGSIALLAGLLFASCREDEVVPPSEKEELPKVVTAVKGLYLLNEGNMGMNKASLDYYDYRAGVYTRNIYAERNPTRVDELGDVGNDLQIYGGKLYAVINCSHLVEVMEMSNTRHLAEIKVPNCRYITFHKGKGYISSYAGPVQLNNKRIGQVIEFDTATFAITRQVNVGYQPEEMAVVGGKLYVANSGGYTADDYDHTISVVDLQSFREVKKIDVAPNLHRLKADRYGDLYVTSRGDYYDAVPKLYIIDTQLDELKQTIDLEVSNLYIAGDTAWMHVGGFNFGTGQASAKYRMLNVKTEAILNDSFITDGTDALIERPYGIAVDPISRAVYVTDAKNYLSSGTLYCFDTNGKQLWSRITGDIPAHIAFVTE